MELTDRYLYAVSRNLPKNQREDIIAELSDSIQSQVEEKEASLGRALTPDEECAIIKGFGHPLIVASRYRTRQYLIGPLLLPFYWQTLRIVLIAALVANVLLAFGTGFVSGGAVQSFARFWVTVWGTLFFAVGAVTVVFGALEYFGSSLTAHWNPKTLPKAKPFPGGPNAWIQRWQSAFELAWNIFIILLFTNLIPGLRYATEYLLVGPGAGFVNRLPFAFAPIWHLILMAVVIMCSVHAVMNVVTLLQPTWVKLRAATLTLTSVFMAFVMALSLRTPALIVPGANWLHNTRILEASRALGEIAWSILFVSVVSYVIAAVVYARLLAPPKAPRALVRAA